MNNKRPVKSALGRSEHLRYMFKHFISPMFQDMTVANDTEETLSAKLELWFDIKYRDIILFKAKRAFRIRGPRWVTKSTPEKFVDGTSEMRDIEAGDALWVRIDARNLNYIDVETTEGVFRVSVSDFQVYYEWLDEVT